MNKLKISFVISNKIFKLSIASVFLSLFTLNLKIVEAKQLNLPQPVSDNDFIKTDKNQSLLGQLLFFDPILSGNKNIACSTCHHPNFATSDSVSLSLGEGGKGLGRKRIPVKGKNRPEQRIPRNAPALFNLGAKEFTVMFHDGRLEADSNRNSGIRTPLEDEMMLGFDSILSAQTMFPVLSPDEMAGHYSENEVSKAVRMGLITGPDGAWQKISERIQNIPEYVSLFKETIPSIKTKEDIRFTDISNVIATFIASEWKAVNSPFDRFLEGDSTAISEKAKQGLKLFYGKANCSSCHSGSFQTDHKFHAIAVPEFGPGKIARFESNPEDLGRMRVTGKQQDKYKFRTPSLRNVSLTAPYGHNGAFANLNSVIKHHLSPAKSLANYSFDELIIPPLPEQDEKEFDRKRLSSKTEDLLNASEIRPIDLDKTEIEQIITFLDTLTDSNRGKGRLGIPKEVPSKLAVE